MNTPRSRYDKIPGSVSREAPNADGSFWYGFGTIVGVIAVVLAFMFRG